MVWEALCDFHLSFKKIPPVLFRNFFHNLSEIRECQWYFVFTTKEKQNKKKAFFSTTNKTNAGTKIYTYKHTLLRYLGSAKGSDMWYVVFINHLYQLTRFQVHSKSSINACWAAKKYSTV